MTDQKEIPVVSMNNTKKEMIDAYNAAKQRLEATEKRLLDAEKVRRKMEEKAADVVAESQASQDPLQRQHIKKFRPQSKPNRKSFRIFMKWRLLHLILQH